MLKILFVRANLGLGSTRAVAGGLDPRLEAGHAFPTELACAPGAGEISELRPEPGAILTQELWERQEGFLTVTKPARTGLAMTVVEGQT